MDKAGCSRVGFGDQSVAVHWHGSQALALIDFLCCDLQLDTTTIVKAEYELFVDRDKAIFSLQHKEQQLYCGEDYYELAYTLINEIIYRVVVDNSDGLAIHAAALSGRGSGGGILLPGTSGSGKSTLTAWLVTRGCNYLSDELVLLDETQAKIYPFTRPVSFKQGSLAVLASFTRFDIKKAVAGANGLMLPHRLLGEGFTPETPPLSLVLFPQYVQGVATEITPLSGALGCARLLECYVNARNLENHGIDRLAAISRSTPIYQLTYGSFDGLYDVLNNTFPDHFR